jgi:hypothetical protein
MNFNFSTIICFFLPNYIANVIIILIMSTLIWSLHKLSTEMLSHLDIQTEQDNNI